MLQRSLSWRDLWIFYPVFQSFLAFSRFMPWHSEVRGCKLLWVKRDGSSGLPGWSHWFHGLPDMWEEIASQSLGPGRGEGLHFPSQKPWKDLPPAAVPRPQHRPALHRLMAGRPLRNHYSAVGLQPLSSVWKVLEVTRAYRTTRLTS